MRIKDLDIMKERKKVRERERQTERGERDR
jgi:hypothetical protein